MISELKTSIRSYTILISTTLLALMMAMALVPACGGEQTDTPPSDANRTGQAASTATLAATSTPRPSSGSPSATATATASVPDAARDTEKRAEDQRAVTPTIPPAAATTPITIAAAIPTPTSVGIATPAAGGAGSIDCGDFQTWEDAQQFFIERGGPDRDEYRFDTDGDGIACNAESDQGAEIQPFEAPESATEPQDATPEPVPAPAPGRPTVVAAATPEPTPEATPASVIRSEAPLREYTAEEIGAVDWSRFEQDGHVFSHVLVGGRIRFRSGAGVNDYTEVECGPEIGSSLDSRSSRTWSDHSHVIWVWFENPDEERENRRSGCIQVSRYEDWPNKEAARPSLSAREVDALRAERLGEDLVYFYQVNDRSYTMPPGSQGLYEVMRTDSYIVSHDGDFTGVCWAHQLPNALWTVERGFVAMPDEDVISRYRRADYTEEILENMREAREAGWFYVYGNNPIGGSGYGCWQVGNPEEVPVEPCIVCHIRR